MGAGFLSGQREMHGRTVGEVRGPRMMLKRRSGVVSRQFCCGRGASGERAFQPLSLVGRRWVLVEEKR